MRQASRIRKKGEKDMSMPAELDEPWQLYAGDDAIMSLTLTAKKTGEPIDVTDLDLRAAWRKSKDSTEQVLLDLQVIDATQGKLQIYISHDQTSVESGTIRSGVFDLQTVNSAGFVRTLVRGKVKWTKDVTR